MGRLRVPVDYRALRDRSLSLAAVLAIVAIIILLCSFPVRAADRLILAHTHNAAATGQYRTTLYATGGDTAATLHLTDLVISGADWQIPALNAAIARNAGEASSIDFTLIDVPDGLSVVSMISYTSPNARTSFAVGPIGAVDQGNVALMGPVAIGTDDGLWITTFPEEPTPMIVTFLTADRRPFAQETFVAASPVYQHRAAVPLEAGFVSVSVGAPAPWYCFPRDCASYAPVYGFASSSSGDGLSGNMRVFPFGH